MATTTRPTSHSVSFLSNPSHKIKYTSYGPSESTSALVLIHGWTCNSSMWLPSLQPLLSSPHRRTILIDLPGHGESSADLSGATYYNIEFFTAAVLHVLDVANVSSAVLVGHSLGGVVTTMILRTDPTRVLGIIYLDSFFSLPEHYQTQAERRKGVEQASGEKFRDFFNIVYSPRTTPEIIRQIQDATMSTPEFVRLATKGTDKLPPLFRRDEVFPNTPALQVMTIEFVADIKLYPEWTRILPRLEMESWNEGQSAEMRYGHFLFMEDPQRCMDSIEGFLKRHDLLQG